MTGATGFVGSYVVAELLAADPRAHVVALTRSNDRRLLEYLAGATLERVSFRTCDVTASADVKAVLCDARPEHVVHLAGVLGRACDVSPGVAVEVNGLGAVNLLEAARDCQVPHLILGSSVAVYGAPRDHPDGVELAESSSLQTRTLYGATKLLSETVLRRLRPRGSVWSALRMGLIYGAGRSASTGSAASFLMDMFSQATTMEKITFKYGNELLDLTYVKDAARAVRLALHALQLPDVVNIVGHRTTLADVAAVLREQVPGLEIAVEEGSWGGPMRYSGALAASALGYRPQIGLVSAIADALRLERGLLLSRPADE